MYVDAQWIITSGAVLTALGGILTLGWKLFQWVNHQKEQDLSIQRLSDKFESEIERVENMHKRDQGDIQEEQTLVMYGLLACLKGLAAQGCNGPVSEAIEKIEKHINKKAHQG